MRESIKFHLMLWWRLCKCVFFSFPDAITYCNKLYLHQTYSKPSHKLTPFPFACWFPASATQRAARFVSLILWGHRACQWSHSSNRISVNHKEQSVLFWCRNGGCPLCDLFVSQMIVGIIFAQEDYLCFLPDPTVTEPKLSARKKKNHIHKQNQQTNQ